VISLVSAKGLSMVSPDAFDLSRAIALIILCAKGHRRSELAGDVSFSCAQNFSSILSPTGAERVSRGIRLPGWIGVCSLESPPAPSLSVCVVGSPSGVGARQVDGCNAFIAGPLWHTVSF
jgi:hypothetical protein